MKLFKMCLVLIMVMLFAVVANAGDIQKSFRGVDWETSVASLKLNPDFVVQKYSGSLTYFEKKNENLSLGNIKLTELIYVADRVKGFGAVVITYTEPDRKAMIIMLTKIMQVPYKEGYDPNYGSEIVSWTKGEIVVDHLAYPVVAISYIKKNVNSGGTF